MVAPLASSALKLASSLSGVIGQAAGRGPAQGTSAPGTPAQDKARKTADDFETMFLEQMMERLTESAGAEGPLGENGTGGGVYRSMLAKEYAGAMSKAGGIGLSNQVYAEILKLQEGGAHVGR